MRVSAIYTRVKKPVEWAPPRMSSLVQSPYRYWIVLFCGMALSFVQPPFYFWPVIFFVLPLLYSLVCCAANMWQAAALGFVFGFGFFGCGLHWLYRALLVAGQFPWLLVPAFFVTNAYLAAYLSATCWALYMSRSLPRFLHLFVFGMVWVFFESLRGSVLIPIPMHYLGYAWGCSEALLQTASLVGVYGLSLLTVWIACTPVMCWMFSRRGALMYCACVISIVLCLYGWGDRRLCGAERIFSEGAKSMVRVVQGGIAQQMLRKNSRLKHQMLQRYTALSMLDGYEKVNYFVWGENVMPYALNVKAHQIKALVERFLLEGRVLLVGGRRIDAQRVIYNTLFVVNAEGQVLNYYDKQWLVPFGEFFPLMKQLRPVLPGSHRGFTPGQKKPGVLSAEATLLLPSICYESLFQDVFLSALVAETNRRVQWIVNVTNDGWFQGTIGPYQNLAMAKMRAVELGIPFVRAANTGISAVYDGYGQELGRIPFGESGILDINIPDRLNKTTFSRYVATQLKLKVVIFIMVIFLLYFCLSGFILRGGRREEF